MEHIVAALIIACSNLTQPAQSRQATVDVIEQKRNCIARVTKCAEDTKYQERNFLSFTSKCSKEVY